MAYAILQKDLRPPELARLQRAFEGFPDLTAQDAIAVLRDAHGVLLRGLDEDRANALCDALQREQVPAEAVRESELPAIPMARLVNHLEWQDGRLILSDPMQRHYALAADELMLVAAGIVLVREFRRERNIWEEPGFHMPGVSRDTISGVRSKEHSRETLMLELFPRGGQHRFSVLAEELSYAFLGQRCSSSPTSNAATLVRDLAGIAPQAGLNRGAWHLTQADADWIRYPTRHAFFEELIWMLWRSHAADGSPG